MGLERDAFVMRMQPLPKHSVVESLEDGYATQGYRNCSTQLLCPAFPKDNFLGIRTCGNPQIQAEQLCAVQVLQKGTFGIFFKKRGGKLTSFETSEKMMSSFLKVQGMSTPAPAGVQHAFAFAVDNCT